MEMTETMYQSIGGDPGLTQLVDRFYTRVWSDPELKGYFEGIDKDDLKRHQRSFLTFALGGGPDTGKSLPDAHTGLKITDAAFDRVAKHLRYAMEELDVDKSLAQIIAGFVQGKRSSVVMQTGY
jgi:hemoglobin